MPVEALLTERVTGLPEAAYRVLETICCSPRHMGQDLVTAIAARDGLSDETFADGVATLQRERWVDASLSLGTADASLRSVMRNIIPPARAAELHGYAADIVRKRMPEPCFGSGEIAYHLFEAGRLPNAASALVDAAHAAMETGFQRMALRLLATAVEWDPSTQIRKAARELAQSARPPMPSAQLVAGAPSVVIEPPQPANDSARGDTTDEDGNTMLMGQNALRSALDALTRRDFEATERWLDAMLAGGGSLAPALRVLALSHLMRGDPESAAQVLQRQLTEEAPAATRARDLLCWSLVRLAQGDAAQAIRLGLASLSLARRQPDVRGEAAALQVLSFAYRALEREQDALQLEAAAEARLQAHLPSRAAV
jgi:tetratricopeptide (TPR) repeat protein